MIHALSSLTFTQASSLFEAIPHPCTPPPIPCLPWSLNLGYFFLGGLSWQHKQTGVGASPTCSPSCSLPQHSTCHDLLLLPAYWSPTPNIRDLYLYESRGWELYQVTLITPPGRHSIAFTELTKSKLLPKSLNNFFFKCARHDGVWL
jgi:hypothetical protein